jgi:cytochrome c oxidase subunit 2
MAIAPPEERIWWNERIERGELVWIVIAFLWGLVMFFMMVYWHIEGKQNLSNEAYRIDPAVFEARTNEFAEKYKVREDGDTGYPIVKPPAGGDAYMLARLWEWWPVLELEKGQTYRVHLSSLDWQHGFSEHVVTMTPTETGVFGVVCNEFCGLGHHQMVGRIRVVEPGTKSQ